MEKAQPKQLKGFRIVKKIIENEFTQHLIASKLLFNLTDKVAVASKLCIDCLKNGGKILIFGNGGSAADAQHIAAELVGRYKINRKLFQNLILGFYQILFVIFLIPFI